MTSEPYRPFFRYYYTVLYLLFPLALVASITGMDLCMALLFVGWLAELSLHPQKVTFDRELAGVLFLFLGLLLVPELINYSWQGLEELVVHHYRKVFLLFLIVATLRSRRLLKWARDGLVLAGALACLLTVVAYLTEWSFLGRFLTGGYTVEPGGPLRKYTEEGLLRGRFRGSGPGNWKSIQFASVVAFIFPWAYYLFHRSRSRGRTLRVVVYGTGSVLILLGVVVSQSRMPLFALLLLMAIDLVLRTAVFLREE